MAQVPYNPVPQVEPTQAAVPSVHVDAPTAAFGGATAEAFQSLGREVQGAGDKLWNRAVQMKELDSESNVNNAVTANLLQSGQLTNNFRQLSGDQPQKALADHTDALVKGRADIRASLGSDYERKLFDRETMRRQGYDILNSSSHAADQLKTFNKQSAIAKQDATIDRMASDPFNEDYRHQTIKDLISSEGELSMRDGDSPEMTANRIKARVGQAIGTVAGTMSKTDPDKADALMADYKDKMPAGVYDKAMETVRERGIQVRATMEAAKISDPASTIRDISSGTNLKTGGPMGTPQGLIVHHTGGGGDVNGVISTLQQRGLSVQYVVDRDGQIFRTTPEGQTAYHIMPGWGAQGAGKSNSNMEGVEVIARNDKDVTPAQQAAVVSLAHSRGEKFGYDPATSTFGHGEVNPGHKEADEGMSSTNLLRNYKDNQGDEGMSSVKAVRGQQTSQEQQLVNKNKLIEQAADRLYPTDKDAVSHQQFIDQMQRNMSIKSSQQQKALNDEIKGLKVDVGQTLINPTDKGRGPTSVQEANQINPAFQDKSERLQKLDPTFKARQDNWFERNAKQDIPHTQERQAEYIKYLGLSDEDRMKVDANQMFNQGKLTQGLANKVLEDQGKIHRVAETNQLVEPILSRHHELLNDAKAYPSKTDASANERYTWLKGALIDRITANTAKTGARMTPKEQDETMESLVQEVTTHEGYLWNSTDNRFVQESLQHPVAVAGKEDYAKLRSGQHYIGPDGKRAVKQ